MNLLTRMKSPTSSVGRIDDDGILNGSARNERSRKTTSRTGKNDFEYSTQMGSAAPAGRCRARNRRSISHTTPVTVVRTNRISAKFIEDLRCERVKVTPARQRRGIVARENSRS